MASRVFASAIRDILEDYLPEVLRFFLLTRHYRSPVDFSAEAMDEAEKNVRRLYETLSLLDKELEKAPPKGGKLSADIREEYESLCKGFDDAMADDINTAAALGHMNSLAHLVNRILDDKALRKNAEARELLQDLRHKWDGFGAVLGLLESPADNFLQSLKQSRAKRASIDVAEVERLMEERRIARQNKDFAASDALRDKIAEQGAVVRDTSDGAVWDIA